MKRIILIILEIITKRKAVYLLDRDGDISMSLAYKDPFGVTKAERWWPTSIRTVVLNEDGSVTGGYVIRWKYLRPIAKADLAGGSEP
jgi:hypothetical protein